MTTLIEVQHWPMVEDPLIEVEFEICTYMDSDSLSLNVDLIEEWGNLYCTTCSRIWECCQCDEPRQAIR